MTNDPVSQLSLAVIASYAIQYFKNSPHFKWISDQTPWLNRIIAAITSLAAAVGVHYTAVHTDDGTWIITLTGLTLPMVGHYAWAWLSQATMQQLAYAAAVKQPSTVPMVSKAGEPGQAVVAVPPAAAGSVVTGEKKP